jgi:crotonobetainyl-CoA:carnitine CoA-transferase CaiB-like acyl-CoA transferase
MAVATSYHMTDTHLPLPSVEEPDEALPLFRLPALAMGAGFDMLAGVRVLDLTTSIAGPFATMQLGDMGAEIIKVERPGTGDDARSWGPPFLNGESLWFMSVNRNKRSVALDYSTPEGAEILRGLAAACDVVFVNQPPRIARKLGVDAQSLRSVREDLIYVSITGFGLEGERADWTCYDLIAEGYSGVMDLTGDANGEPQKIGAPAADMLAGHDAAFAAVAALFSRDRTGQGRTIDVSLVESMTRFLGCRIVPFLGSGDKPRRSGGRDSVIAIYQAFETADEPITLGLGNDNIWRRFWEAVDSPAFGADPRFSSNARRRARREEIVEHIQSILVTRPRDHWLALLARARVPAGPINRTDEVACDAELQRRRLFYRLESNGRTIPQVGTGFHIDGNANVPRLPPPELGEHTYAVLSELTELDNERLAQLADLGVIAGVPK